MIRERAAGFARRILSPDLMATALRSECFGQAEEVDKEIESASSGADEEQDHGSRLKGVRPALARDPFGQGGIGREFGRLSNTEAEKMLKRTYAAPALEKGFEIFEALAARPNGASLSEMADDLDRTMGELYRMVLVLEQLGYLHKSAHSDRYRVSYKLLDLALRATPGQHLVRTALPEMRELAENTGQSCHFAVANRGQILVIARAESPDAFGFALNVGTTLDMIESCSGQVITAYSRPERAKRMISDAQERQSRIVDRAWLAERMARVRERGFSSRPSQTAPGVTGISYPVFEYGDEITGALTMPFLELIDGSNRVDFETAKTLLQSST